MTRPISLKVYIVLAFLSLSIVLVIGYSLLSAQYYMRGMDNIMASNLEQAIISYKQVTSQKTRDKAQTFGGYQISRYWEQQSNTLRDAFNEPPLESSVLYKYDDSKIFQPPDVLYFLMRFDEDGEILYISNSVSRDTASELVGRNAQQSLHTLLLISLLSATSLGLITWLLLRQISKPISALNTWTRSLNAEQLNQPAPDFSYPELNELAKLIQTSLSSVQQSLEREHSFLRHASHELRTPISIVRNNVELIQKLQSSQKSRINSNAHQQSIKRIDRASLTMKYLTETLLWLSHQENTTLATSPVALDELIKQLIQEVKYLLIDKDVELIVLTEPCILYLPESPTRIVLGNLIRNALQHTQEGKIWIKQTDQHIVVTNTYVTPQKKHDVECGFGLGLQLTQKLTARLQWEYHHKIIDGKYRTIITF